MKVIKCDRCGKEIEEKTSLDEINSLHFLCRMGLKDRLKYNGKYDLCDECFVEISDKLHVILQK